MSHEHEPVEIPEGALYETHDVKASVIWKSLFWFFAISMVCALVCIPILNGLGSLNTAVTGDPDFKDTRIVRELPAGQPPLQTNVTTRTDMFAIGKKARVELETYGWVDEAKGKVRVPVAKAMDDVARDGLPVWKAAPATPPAETVPTEEPAPGGATTP
ncbi:MAG: hypothetical protein KIS66_13265 [Fimbriimonadaceae bacterium]|nr:hypothetical protein [Fimbriimonadaceae bacterium]